MLHDLQVFVSSQNGQYSRLSLSRNPRDSLTYSRYTYLDTSDSQNWGKIIRTTTFNKYICYWTLEVRDILKILWKRGGAISPLFHNIFYLLLDFHDKAGTRFSLRDKRLFEISEVKITRINCTWLIPDSSPFTIFKTRNGMVGYLPCNKILPLWRHWHSRCKGNVYPRHKLMFCKFYQSVTFTEIPNSVGLKIVSLTIFAGLLRQQYASMDIA